MSRARKRRAGARGPSLTPRRAAVGFVAVLAGGLAYGYLTADVEAVHIDPAASYFPVDMPNYPGAVEFPMSSEMVMNGSQLYQSYFYTGDSAEKVLGWYRSVWESQGYTVYGETVPDGEEGHIHVVDAALDYRKGVTARRDGKQTLVLPSAIKGVGAFLPPESDSSFPALEGSFAVSRMETYEQGRRARTYMYANTRSFDDNVAFVREQMSAAGWHEVTASAAQGSEHGAHLQYARPGQSMNVNIVEHESGTKVGVSFVEVSE